MKALNVISGIAFLGLIFLSSSGNAQINVDNNTCHSMFVTANWGSASGCTPCSGCNTSGVVAPGSGTIGGSGVGPSGSENLRHLTAGLNAYSCTQLSTAWEDCAGYAVNGESDCCMMPYWEYRVTRNGTPPNETIVIEPL